MTIKVSFSKPSVLVSGETAPFQVTMQVSGSPVKNVKAVDLDVRFMEKMVYSESNGNQTITWHNYVKGKFFKEALDRWITEGGVIMPGAYEHVFDCAVPAGYSPTFKVSGGGLFAANIVKVSLVIRKKGWWRRDKRFKEPLDVADPAAPKDNGPPAIEILDPYVQRKVWFGRRVDARVAGALDGTVKELGDSIQLTVTVANPHPTRNLVLKAPSFKEKQIIFFKGPPLRRFCKKQKSPFVLTSVSSGCSGGKPSMNLTDKQALIVPASESRTFTFIGTVPIKQLPSIDKALFYNRLHAVTFKVKPISGFLGFTRNCYSLDYHIPDSRFSLPTYQQPQEETKQALL